MKLLNLSPGRHTLQGRHCKSWSLQLIHHQQCRKAYTPVKSVVAIIEKSFLLAHILQADGACVKPALFNISSRVTAGGHCACETEPQTAAQVPQLQQ